MIVNNNDSSINVNFSDLSNGVYIINISSDNVTVSLTYNNNGNPSALAYIDYISLESTRQLTYAGNHFTFYNTSVTSASGIGEYNIANTSQVNEIWDVTDIYNIRTAVNSDSNDNMSFKRK